MVLPRALVPIFSRAKWLADRQVPTLEQTVLADFIAEGHLERHIRRMRWSKTGLKGPSHYDRQRQAMVTALQTHFGDGQRPAPRGHRATILGENAGLHMMVRFQTTIPDAELIARAEQVSVGLIPVAPQYLGDSPGHEFIFSCTELDRGAIATGIEKLASLFQ
jgi:GntR family transcriptional regulator/MocR family aminotransferase